uniref:Glutathione S-transferase (EC) n=1 Tax=uncultured Thiotrichaceae bacterium TaxID=298394 RepID=A0A6S6UF25_9GAMM|nr:MAG: Glutathione S-transferase (EC [uncultured Thiotrichaceae bacterium]
MYKLFYYPRNASWAPHMVLQELGAEHELVLVDRKSEVQKGQDYLKINPTGRIPTLLDGETAIFESAAICIHLSDAHVGSKLIPTSPSHRAQFFQWLFYLTTTIQPELMLHFYPEKHAEPDHCRQSIIENQERRLGEMFELVDKQLSRFDYMAGNTLTLCDFFLFMLSDWAGNLKKTPLSYPYLGAHLRNLAKRPSIVDASHIEGTSLEAYR